jgi:hypothetical protein
MKLRQAILATALAACTSFTADAALITWGAAQNIVTDTDVSTAGTLVGAINAGGAIFGTPAVTTVNGVSFDRFDFPGTTPVGIFSSAGITLGTNYVSGNAPFSLLSADYQNLLQQNFSAFTNPYTLTMSGLDVGATYAFQWWASDSNNAGVSTTATAGAVAVLDNNVPNADGGLGQYVVGTFVADAATQSVEFVGVFNAAQLRQLAPAPVVPEPGTALAGLALAGFVGLRRRRTSAHASC